MKLPQQYITKIKQLLGDDYEQYADSFENDYYHGLRVNTLKISVEEFQKISPFSLKKIPWTENGFYYESKEQPAKHPFYHAGLYYIQEPSAMAPASFLPVEPGDKVLDLCAAPGGKTTQLGADLMGEGVLVSNDISHSRAKALLKNVELLGITNAVVLSESPEHLSGRFFEYFDKILIDAPCSGEGMFRKDPGMVKNWETNGPEYYAALQKDITSRAVKMLKPGGKILYSTCTFSPEENEQTIEYLLEQDPDLELIDLPDYSGFDQGHPEWTRSGNPELKKCRRLWPHRIQGEGHFIALLKKKPKDGAEHKSYPYKKVKLTPECEQFMGQLNLDIDPKRLMQFGENLYLLPEDLADITGLRILRSGLYLGQIKKKRFEPSQALAMALKDQDFNNSIALEGDAVIKYLKCETIEAEGRNGYALMCIDKHPLGWGKLTNGTLKNKYYAGWRWLS